MGDTMGGHGNHFWITAHWAHGLHDPDDLPWHLYRKVLKPQGHRVGVGDRVLFYECLRRSRGTIDRLHRGARTPVELGPGAGGIVRAARIVGERRAIRDDDVLYDYGGIERWKFLTPCEIDAVGRVTLQDIQNVLGRKVAPLGFGLFSLEPDEFEQLFSRLRSGG